MKLNSKKFICFLIVFALSKNKILVRQKILKLKLSFLSLKKNCLGYLKNNKVFIIFLNFCIQKKNRVFFSIFFDICQILHSYSKYNGFPQFFFSLHFTFLFLSFFLKVQFLILSKNLLYEEKKMWWKFSFNFWVFSIVIQIFKIILGNVIPIPLSPVFTFPKGFVNIHSESPFYPRIRWVSLIPYINQKSTAYWSFSMLALYCEISKLRLFQTINFYAHGMCSFSMLALQCVVYQTKLSEMIHCYKHGMEPMEVFMPYRKMDNLGLMLIGFRNFEILATAWLQGQKLIPYRTLTDGGQIFETLYGYGRGESIYNHLNGNALNIQSKEFLAYIYGLDSELRPFI